MTALDYDGLLTRLYVIDAVPAWESKRLERPVRTAKRYRLGDRFLAGVVLHTGPRVFGLGERIVAAPISSIWG